MKDFYQTFKTLLIFFIIIVTGFNVYYLATDKVPPPSFYSLGITSDSVIVKFEKLGFNFNSSDSVYEQPLTIGLSRDKNATIHLIGPKEDLVNIKIVIRLAKKVTKFQVIDITNRFSKSQLKLLHSYLKEMISLVYPNWIMGDKWLEENALDLSGSGRRTKKLNDIKLTLVISEKNMTLGLAFGDWDNVPKYDTKKQLWKHHD